MRTSVIVSVLAATLLATAAYAQNTAGDQEKGSTGWSGGSKDQPSQSVTRETTGQGSAVHDQALAKDQAPVATGLDLKGPPVQLAPSQTPE